MRGIWACNYDFVPDKSHSSNLNAASFVRARETERERERDRERETERDSVRARETESERLL